MDVYNPELKRLSVNYRIVVPTIAEAILPSQDEAPWLLVIRAWLLSIFPRRGINRYIL